jgi:hypothetical protein
MLIAIVKTFTYMPVKKASLNGCQSGRVGSV